MDRLTNRIAMPGQENDLIVLRKENTKILFQPK